MGFLGDIVSSVADVFTGGGGIVSDILGSIGGGVSDTGLGSLGSLSGIFDSINSTVSSIKDTVAPIISSIGDTVHQITDTVQHINNDLIQPIVGPIKTAIDSFGALADSIHRDLSAGLKGILNIPTDIANAFGSLDASLQRSMQILNAGGADNIKGLLIPGLMTAFGNPMSAQLQHFEHVLPFGKTSWTPPPVVHPTDGAQVADFKAYVEKQQQELLDNESLPAQFFNLLFKAVGILEGLAAQREPYVELWREEVMRAAGIRKFGAGDVQGLLARQEITPADAVEELRSTGFSDSRAQLLVGAARTLPDTNRALDLYLHGYILRDVCKSMLLRQGWSDDDAETLLFSAAVPYPVDILFELLRRGVLQPEDVIQQLRVHGFAQGQAEALMVTATRQLGLEDIVQLVDRAQATGGGLGFNVLNQAAPPEFIAQAKRLGVTEQDADILWLNHWRLLTPELAVNAFFRGYITRPMLDTVLASSSLPKELMQNFIDLQRPLVPTRSITTLMSQGIITQVDAENILRARGFDDVSVNWLVQLERKSAAPSQAAVSDQVHGLTQTVIFQLFTSGAIDEPQATALLTELGWAPEAISANLTLLQVKDAADQRTSSIAVIIAGAKAGLLTYQDAVSSLASLGLTATEQNKALAQLTTQVTQRTKMPSEAQIISMFKHGLLEQAAALDALGLLGYSDAWANLLLQLGEASGTQPVQ